MKKTLALTMLAFAISTSHATNGFSVSMAYRDGAAPEAFLRAGYFGKLVRFDISNNAVVRCDTLCKSLGCYPSISFDGARVAFFRSAMSLNAAGSPVGRIDTGWISVVNKDGTNLRDLVKLYAGQYGYGGCFYQDCEGGFVDWPAGDWIYYERPPKTGEIWRVNVQDPSLNHLVVRYNDDEAQPGNCACLIDGKEGFWIRRFQLSADARYCGGMIKWSAEGQQISHAFPPPEGYAPYTMPMFGNLSACNLAMSASGKYVSSYNAGCHTSNGIYLFDHSANFLNSGQSAARIELSSIISWIGGRVPGDYGQYMRWASNSDKWYIIHARWRCNSNGSNGSNQVLVNWKESRAICPSTNVRIATGITYDQDAGDFWIDDPVNNPDGNKYEDPNGNWVPVVPRDIYLNWSVAGGNPYQVSISAYPSDADIRYTTDGSEPTQSSSRYTAQLNLNAQSGRTTQIKAKAFRTGMIAGDIENRLIVPESKALPAGYIKEMLCLENQQGTMIVPMADSAGIYTRYVGSNRVVPFDGDQVTVNGHTYTWHLRTDDDGVWSPATASNSLVFWYTTIISPKSRMVNLGARFRQYPKIILDGRVVFHFEGWDGNHEWLLSPPFQVVMGLLKGANGVLMQQHPEGVFGVRLLDRSNNDLTDLRYYPYAGASQSISLQRRPIGGSLSFVAAPDHVLIRIGPNQPCAVRILDVKGRIRSAMDGRSASTLRLSAAELGSGVHLIAVTVGATEQTYRVVIR